MCMTNIQKDGFKRKVYTHIHSKDLLCDVPFKPSSLNRSSKPLSQRPIQKRDSSITEECKQIFLPTLIDIFQIRQKLHKTDLFTAFEQWETTQEPPLSLRKQLLSIRSDVQEAQRWCDVILKTIDKSLHIPQSRQNKGFPWLLAQIRKLFTAL